MLPWMDVGCFYFFSIRSNVVMNLLVNVFLSTVEEFHPGVEMFQNCTWANP